MLKRLLCAAAVLATQPALALTCLPVTVAGALDMAEARETAFVVALGDLSRTGDNVRDVPDSGIPNQAVGYHFPALFSGRFLSKNGFSSEDAAPVTVEVSCISAWCGWDSLSDRGLYIFFETPDGLWLEAGVCGGFFFDDPSDAQITALTDAPR